MKGIRTKLLSGMFFTAIAKYSSLVISLIVTAILARLLAPDEFGVIAVATVIISFLNMISDFGLTSTIIQYKNLRRVKLGILFSWSLYLSLLLSISFFFIAPLIAAFYEQPSLNYVCRWLSISLFFSGASVVPSALFYRDQLFKNLALRSFLVQSISGIVAICVAFWGGGIFALIIGPLLSSVLTFGISYQRYPLVFFVRPSAELLRSIYRYSGYQFLFNVINFFSRNADTLLIGKYLSMGKLGQYDKAYRLMSLPLQNITQVITPVMHPVLREVAHDRNYLRNFNEHLVKILASLGFTLSVFLYFAAEELIWLFFGAQWQSAVGPFKALSISIGTQIILSSSGAIFQTVGNTRLLFFSGLVSAILNVSGVCFGVFFGKSITAVAFSLSVTFSINFVFTYLLMYRAVFRFSILDFFKTLISPMLWSAILGAIFLMYNSIIPAPVEHIESLSYKCIIFFSFLAIFISRTRLISSFRSLGSESH